MTPEQRCFSGSSCLLTPAVVAFASSSEQGLASDVRVQLPSLKFPLGYKIQQGLQASVQQPLCTPLCEVEGTTILFQVSMLSPYHYFRDNLAWLARALSKLEVLGIHKPANKTLRLMLLGLTASKGRISPVLSYLSAFTDSPVLVAPIQSVCARFERLLVGVLRVGAGPTQRSTGQTLRHPLSSGLGFSHCSLQPLPARPRPRITLLLRQGASHGVAMGRKVLNPDEVAKALSTLGPVLNVSFDGQSLEYQLRVMQRTDFLVGVHGAGLSNGMFLDPCGVLVEMWPLGRAPAGPYSDFHSNYAQVTGHDPNPNPNPEPHPNTNPSPNTSPNTNPVNLKKTLALTPAVPRRILRHRSLQLNSNAQR